MYAVMTQMLQRNLSPADKFDYILSQYRRLAGGDTLAFNNAVFVAEQEQAHHNLALGYYMKENGCFPDGTSLKQTMDLYFQVVLIFETCNNSK